MPPSRTTPRSARRGPGAVTQPVHEDALDLPAQVQRHAADARSPCIGRALQQGLDLVGRVVDARHQRGDQHAGRNAGAVELRHRLQPGPRVGRVRLGSAPRLLVERRDRQARADARSARRSAASAAGRAATAATWSAPNTGWRSRASPPRCPPSACSGPRPTGTDRCSSRAPRARVSTTAAPAPRAAPQAR